MRMGSLKSAVSIAALLGLIVDAFVRFLERVLLSWRPSFTGT